MNLYKISLRTCGIWSIVKLWSIKKPFKLSIPRIYFTMRSAQKAAIDSMFDVRMEAAVIDCKTGKVVWTTYEDPYFTERRREVLAMEAENRHE